LTAPRLFGIPARDADVVAVLRRGPSEWCALGRWDLATGRYEQGAWLRGTLYPQRCDLSPDGRWFCAFVLDHSASWGAGWTYVSVSRLPWLRSLAAWGTNGTWTRGMHFSDDTAVQHLGPPDVGDDAPLRQRYGLVFTEASSFAVERRAGWAETDESRPRTDDDHWDEKRAEQVVVGMPRPEEPDLVLTARGGYAAHRSMDGRWYGPPDYRVGKERLDGVQWATWAGDGRLLVATGEGRLQARDGRPGSWRVVEEHDLAALHPDPQPPPPESEHW
jgi:hypothetical protein